MNATGAVVDECHIVVAQANGNWFAKCHPHGVLVMDVSEGRARMIGSSHVHRAAAAGFRLNPETGRPQIVPRPGSLVIEEEPC